MGEWIGGAWMDEDRYMGKRVDGWMDAGLPDLLLLHKPFRWPAVFKFC